MYLDDLASILNTSLPRYPEALAYLKSRRVTAEDVTRYRLGYGKVVPPAPGGTPDMDRFNKETYRGRAFESRISLPIQDSLGRVLGIAGRTVDTKSFKVYATDEAKYTGFFFGLYQALPHIMKENRVFVVEGFFDVIAFSKVFPNVVASITAGMNESQHDQLAMYCDNIVVCFDSDKPGQEGTEKALRWSGVSSVSLGDYKDPATILEKLGPVAHKEYMKRVVGRRVAPF